MRESFLGHRRLALGPWQALERAVLRFFVHRGFEDCRLVGGAGDLGADVLAAKDDQLWVVQVKFREQPAAVPETAIEEVVRAAGRYGAQRAAVATNQFFAPGAVERAQHLGHQLGFPVYLWPGAMLAKWGDEVHEESRAHGPLRDYQLEAVEAVEGARARGARRSLLVLATGLGKTRVATELIGRELARGDAFEALVLAHTVDLVHQFERAMWDVLPKTVPTHIWAGGEFPAFAGGVTVATIQSLAPADTLRLAQRFSMIVVDEAHHAPAATYRRILGELDPYFLLGVTATPWRGDSKAVDEVFGEPVFTMDIVEGMQRDYLAEIDYHVLCDDIDWEEVRRWSEHGYTVRDLNRRLFLPTRDDAIASHIEDAFAEIPRCRALVFSPSIAHADRFAGMLAARGVKARSVHSRLDRVEVTNLLRDFRAGRVECLVSVDLLNEGIDVPDVNLIVFARVTHSRRILLQQLGRGLRIAPGKGSVRVLDFVADLRRVAAAMNLNRSAAEYAGRHPHETLRFPDGQIVRFVGSRSSAFLTEYLRDISEEVEVAGEDVRLRFPPIRT